MFLNIDRSHWFTICFVVQVLKPRRGGLTVDNIVAYAMKKYPESFSYASSSFNPSRLIRGIQTHIQIGLEKGTYAFGSADHTYRLANSSASSGASSQWPGQGATAGAVTPFYGTSAQHIAEQALFGTHTQLPPPPQVMAQSYVGLPFGASTTPTPTPTQTDGNDPELAELIGRLRASGFVPGVSIECLSPEGILLKRFVNLDDVANHLPFPIRGIKEACDGAQKRSSMFGWRYYDESFVDVNEQEVSIDMIMSIWQKKTEQNRHKKNRTSVGGRDDYYGEDIDHNLLASSSGQSSSSSSGAGSSSAAMPSSGLLGPVSSGASAAVLPIPAAPGAPSTAGAVGASAGQLPGVGAGVGAAVGAPIAPQAPQTQTQPPGAGSLTGPSQFWNHIGVGGLGMDQHAGGSHLLAQAAATAALQADINQRHAQQHHGHHMPGTFESMFRQPEPQPQPKASQQQQQQQQQHHAHQQQQQQQQAHLAQYGHAQNQQYGHPQYAHSHMPQFAHNPYAQTHPHAHMPQYSQLPYAQHAQQMPVQQYATASHQQLHGYNQLPAMYAQMQPPHAGMQHAHGMAQGVHPHQQPHPGQQQTQQQQQQQHQQQPHNEHDQFFFM
jgi:hypothetical protein